MDSIHSKVATKVVDPQDIDFRQLWFVLKRRWLPAVGVFCTVMGLAIAAVSLQKPSYTADGRLLFRRDKTSSLTGVGENIKQLSPLTELGNPLKTEAEVLISKPLLKKVAISLDLRDARGELLSADALKSRFKVKDVAATDILQVSYRSSKPEEAADAVNKLMNLYIENNVSTNRAEAAAAREFIAKQLPQVEATLIKAEAALRNFKEQNQVVNLEEEAKAAVQVTADLQKQLVEALAKLANANARSLALQDQVGMNSQAAISFGALSQTAGVQDVLKRLQSVQSDLAVQRARFQSESPIITKLAQQEAELKTLLQDRIRQVLPQSAPVSGSNLQIGTIKEKLIENFAESEANRLGLANQVSSLRDTQQLYQNRLQRMPQLEESQRELERRVKAAQKTYESLLERLQQVQVAENQNIGNARIIESAATPQSSSGLQKQIILGAGSLAGLFLAGVVMLMLELRDPSIKTVKEVRSLFGYLLMAAIPTFDASKSKASVTQGEAASSSLPLPILDTPSLLGEAYRTLRTNLKCLHPECIPKVIVITSAVPQEGKSTVAVNLAIAFKQAGQRVLLVDADLRSRDRHHLWNVAGEKGLTDVVMGQSDLSGNTYPIMPDLHLLPAGSPSPDPMALIDTPQMADLFTACAQKYDVVIVDTPALLVASDALLLGKLADGILLVAKPGVLTPASANFAKELLVHSQQTVLGLVVNGVIAANESHNLFRYSHRYLERKTSIA